MTTNLIRVKEGQQKTWSTGNNARIGNSLVIIGLQLCEAVDVRSGQKVLDVATGSGNTAISAARRFCETTGIDYVPDLIEQAKQRAAAEGLDVAFEVGDAENLPYPDASFDVVVSTVGVMFTPDQEKAAQELLRVCNPGGKIGLANWVPDGYVGNMFRTVGKHFPRLPASSHLLFGAPRIGFRSSWAAESPRWRADGAPTSSATSQQSTS
jgi:ubiquinone/menaquinone biosynthesis C-methylase UbiE